ncbi:MAG: MFS transporter, partial [Firmicutes bacterium]|nr:MFS transporter [Bacillota bacterium]
NIPVGMVAFFSAWYLLPHFPTQNKPFDTGGFFLAAGGFAGLLLGISNAPVYGWNSFEEIEIFIFSIFALGLFVLWEARQVVPLFDLHILHLRYYTGAIIVTLFTMMGLFGVLYLVPVFLETIVHLGSMHTGIALIPLVIGAAVGIPLSGILLPRIGATVLTVSGLIIMGIATLHLSGMGPVWNAGWLYRWMSIIGFGLGIGVMPAVMVAYSSLPVNWMNQGSAMLNLVRQVGSALGVAILTTVLQMNEPVYHSQLAGSFTPGSLISQQWLSKLQQIAYMAGMTAGQGHRWALTYIAQWIKQTAMMWAFHDDFVVAALLIFLGIIPGLFLLGYRQFLRQIKFKEKKKPYRAIDAAKG